MAYDARIAGAAGPAGTGAVAKPSNCQRRRRRPPMKLTTWMPALALALMLTSCEASGPAPHAGPTPTMRTRAQGDEGRAVGSFTRVGGPLGAGGQQPPSVPLSGTVSFSAAHRRTVAVRVGK